MNKRVYGVIGISSIMANWNADFSGQPKSLSDGTIFGSDKALKYPMKKLWDNEGRKVLYIKSMCLSSVGKKGEVTLLPRTLKERYEQIFHVKDLKDCKDAKEILTNLMSAVDVKNFGATFAESGSNIAITGAVQIGQGLNKYEGAVVEEQDILSPFRVSKEKTSDLNKSKEMTDSGEDEDIKKNSTLGTKIVSNEAHYFYPFVINPLAYKEFVEMGVTEGYTEEDYENFHRTVLVSTTSFATNSKVGCENEFVLFVETDIDLYLPNLSEYVTFEKTEDKNRIQIQCGDLFDKLRNHIHKIEVYYNPYTTELGGLSDDVEVYDIRTQERV